MKNISIRLSDMEKQHLDQFCRLTERTQSDVLRQYIRSLAVSGVLNPIDSLAIPLGADPAGTVRESRD